MSRLAVLLAALLPLQATAQDGVERVHDWIGRVAPGYPGGHQEVTGSCIARAAEPCAASVAVVRDAQSKLRTVVALEELLRVDGSRAGGDAPLWRVTDAIVPEVLLRERALEVVTGLCQRDGVDDPRLVAIAAPGSGPWRTRLHGVWRLGGDGRFQPLPAKGVRCLDEGHGYDG